MKKRKDSHRPDRRKERLPFSSSIPHRLSLLILIAATLLVYSNSFKSPFHFDDFSSIVWNGAVHDLRNPQAIWSYSPTRFVTYYLFSLNYDLHKLDVVGYHVLNVLIHLGAGLSAWWLILLMFRTPRMSETDEARHSRLFALFVALVLLVHPVQTQAVTYIVQRAASLATAFYLLSLALYVRARLYQLGGSKALSLVCFVASVVVGLLGLLSKEIVVTLPAAIVLFELMFFKRRTKTGIIILVSIIALFVLVFVLSLVYGLFPIPEAKNITRGQYLLTQSRVLVTYVRLLLIPVGQNVDYDFSLSKSVLDPAALASMIALISLLVAGVFLVRRQRLLSLGIFWFFLTLMPESSIVPIEDVIYEHRLYLPMFGYSVCLVIGLYLLLSQMSRRLLVSLLIVITGAYGVATYARNKIWQDELVLTSDVISKSPRKARAYSSRGYIYINRGDYGRALIDLDKALSLDSLFLDSYLNRGTAYALKGDRDQALRDFNKAIEIDSLELRALTNRANLHMDLGQFDKALQDLNRSLGLQGDNPLIYVNRGLVYYRMGDYTRALADYDRALELNRGLVEGYYNRSLAYYKSGQRELALRDVARMQELGYRVSQEFIEMLRK